MSKINTLIYNDPLKMKKTFWYKSITVRVAVLAWIIIIATLLIFIVGILPTQRKIMEDRMSSEANDIAGSIGQVTATAIINNDYGFTVEHCLKIIKESNSILYIIISRKDGFSLIHTEGEWRLDTLRNQLELPDTKGPVNKIVYSDLVKQEVFHYSYPFNYSGIDWGRINVGLSLKKYNQSISDLTYRTIILAFITIILGLLASVVYASRLTKPILQLNDVSQKVADGDLTVRAKINSENELGNLAETFNRMTESLKLSQDELEHKVEERTAELEKTNKVLHIENRERLAAEQTLKQYNSQLEALDKIYRGIISAKTIDEIIKETLIQMPKLFNFIQGAGVVIYDNKTDTLDVQILRIHTNKENKFVHFNFPI